MEVLETSPYAGTIAQGYVVGRQSVTPLGIIRRAQAYTFIDEDGDVVTLELLLGLSHAELLEFAREVPCRVQPEIMGLLRACNGFYGRSIRSISRAGSRRSSSGRCFLMGFRSRQMGLTRWKPNPEYDHALVIVRIDGFHRDADLM